MPLSIDSYPIGAMLILTVTGLSIVGLLLVHKYCKKDEIRKCHEVGGYLLSVVGTRKAAIKLIKEVTNFEPVTENQKAIYPLLVQETCQLWDNRRARTNIAQYGVPGVEWTVLIIGGIVTVVFTYFFDLESARAQMAMTAMVALLISLNLYLVVLFGAPFSGDLCVGKEAFEVDKLIFDNQLGYRHDLELAPSSFMHPIDPANLKTDVGLLREINRP
jgi:hypothetical protein